MLSANNPRQCLRDRAGGCCLGPRSRVETLRGNRRDTIGLLGCDRAGLFFWNHILILHKLFKKGKKMPKRESVNQKKAALAGGALARNDSQRKKRPKQEQTLINIKSIINTVNKGVAVAVQFNANPWAGRLGASLDLSLRASMLWFAAGGQSWELEHLGDGARVRVRIGWVRIGPAWSVGFLGLWGWPYG